MAPTSISLFYCKTYSKGFQQNRVEGEGPRVSDEVLTERRGPDDRDRVGNDRLIEAKDYGRAHRQPLRKVLPIGVQ